MLRTASKGGIVAGVSCQLPSHQFFLKVFSTLLDTHYLPQSPFSRGDLTGSTANISAWGHHTRQFTSTRHSPRKNSAKEAEVVQLPRFLRRQQQFQSKPMTPGPVKGKRPESNPGPSTFRSRHYDPSKEVAKTGLKPLEPHVLSARLKKSCHEGKIDDAVFMLKNAPLDAQNTQVWNTLIWECLKGKRYQLAYQLFVDMKRRGFSPTTRTFQTMLSGLSRIDNWSTHPKQLANARSLYQAFQRHISSIKKHDPIDCELSIDPLAGYIRILGKAGKYQEIFDVYYAMDQDGPLAPTQFIFTAMFQAIVAAKADTTEGSVKVAADARLLWNQMLRMLKKNQSITPDSYTVTSAISALSGGNEMDDDLAFNIVSEYYGLEANRTIPKPGILPLQAESLAVILRLCNQTKKYELCTQFLQQVKRRPEEIGGASILDRAHLEEVLKADLMLLEPGLGFHALERLEWMLRQEITGRNGPKIRPSLSTYNLVMQSCWYGVDWNSATRTFDLLTGYHAHDFMDGSVVDVPRLDKRGPGRNLAPNSEFMSSFLRTAISTKNRANMRQALRIVEYLGFNTILRSGRDDKRETLRAAKHREFFGTKFSSAVMDTVSQVMEEGGKFARPQEAAKWMSLAHQASGDEHNSPKSATKGMGVQLGSKEGQQAKSTRTQSN